MAAEETVNELTRRRLDKAVADIKAMFAEPKQLKVLDWQDYVTQEQRRYSLAAGMLASGHEVKEKYKRRQAETDNE